MNGKIATNQAQQTAAGEWIERYVNEVGRRLPPNQRADVEREIRSLIEDEVAGRLEAQEEQGAAADRERTVLAVLQQFGAPEEIAARYYAPRYLIGPAMFPIYRIVLAIVLGITLFANILSLTVAAGTGSVAPLDKILLGLFDGIIQAFGMMTLFFVALERLGARIESKPQAWEPRRLPPVKDPNRISIFETVAEIAFTAVILVLANFYLNPGRGALFYNGQPQAIPLFSVEFLQTIPWLTVIWAADILVNIVLLARGRWESATRLAAILVSAATGLIFYRIIAGGPIAAWPPLEPAFKVTAAIIFAVSLWEVGKHAWLLIRNSGLVGDTLRSPHVA